MTDVRKYSLFPKKLSDCVEPLTRPVLKTQGLAGSRVLTEWPSIVGKTLARHTTPEKLSFPKGKTTGGTLTIAAENGFATELQHEQHKIIERLATYFGYQAVSRIAISPRILAAPKPIKPTRRKSPAIDPAVVDQVSDPELKAALSSLARTLSGQPT